MKTYTWLICRIPFLPRWTWTSGYPGCCVHVFMIRATLIRPEMVCVRRASWLIIFHISVLLALENWLHREIKPHICYYALLAFELLKTRNNKQKKITCNLVKYRRTADWKASGPTKLLAMRKIAAPVIVKSHREFDRNARIFWRNSYLLRKWWRQIFHRPWDNC